MQKFTNDNGAEVFVMDPEEVAGFVAEVTRQAAPVTRDQRTSTPGYDAYLARKAREAES